MNTWTSFKAALTSKVVSLQYAEDSYAYRICTNDSSVVYNTMIYKGTVPATGTDGFDIDQTQNDLDKTDWETNYKPYANRPSTLGGKFDPRNARRFGNMTAVGTPEVIVSAVAYTAQASNGQRSIKSSSAVDSFALGTGARVVRLTYLTSAYVLKTEDIQMNGTTAVVTVATDICFIESWRVIAGTAAVGALSLFANTLGTGTVICGIGASTVNAFLCHHYVPVGMQMWLLGWGFEATHTAIFGIKGKMNAQERGASVIDTIVDLFDANALAANARVSFQKSFDSPILLGEKTYVRPTVVPSVASIIIRNWFDFIEDKAIQ